MCLKYAVWVIGSVPQLLEVCTHFSKICCKIFGSKNKTFYFLAASAVMWILCWSVVVKRECEVKLYIDYNQGLSVVTNEEWICRYMWPKTLVVPEGPRVEPLKGGHVQLWGQGRPEACWRDYVSHLAWECFSVPQVELEEIAAQRGPHIPAASITQIWMSSTKWIILIRLNNRPNQYGYCQWRIHSQDSVLVCSYSYWWESFLWVYYNISQHQVATMSRPKQETGGIYAQCTTLVASLIIHKGETGQSDSNSQRCWSLSDEWAVKQSYR